METGCVGRPSIWKRYKAAGTVIGVALYFLGAAPWCPAAAQNSIELSLPIACELGRGCFVQQYPDIDPGPGARDYRCGGATYEGHTGTDFRVLSLKATTGVLVTAAADGRVKAVRDGMEDRLAISEDEHAQTKNRECGNGIVVDHGKGWETQYCHLRRGSVTVQEGQMVSAGAVLGQVGASGQAQFAHVHFTVRQNGRNIDPFSARELDGTCNASEPDAPSGLWAHAIRGSLKYRGATIIENGFSGDAVTPVQAERGDIASLGNASAALVYFVRLINMEIGDSIRIEVSGPNGFHAKSESAALTSNKAHYVAFAGKKLRGDRWPAGQYQGRAELMRGGQILAHAGNTFDLR